MTSGPLRALISTDPWRLSFTQAGRPLAEVPGAPASPYGTLGFSTDPQPAYGGAPSPPPGADWWHATSVASTTRTARGLRLVLATNDPLGRELDVSIDRSGPGSISVRAVVAPDAGAGTTGVTQMGDSFASAGDEHFSGFGGRENLLDQAGQTVEDWSEEGAWTPADRPFIPAFIEPWTDSNRDDGAYFPMGWFVSSRGYGFLLDDSERSLFRLRSESASAWDVEVDAPHLDYRVFAGPRPLDVVRRFSAAVGRQPRPAAPWVLGPWWQPTGPDQATLPETFRRDDVPGSLIMSYTHYLPGGGQVGRTVQERALAARLHAAGYAVTTYFNPMISVQYHPVYDEAKAAGVLLDNELGQPYPLHYNQYVTAEVDFTTAAGRAFYQRLLGEAVANGYDGWMEDFGEYTPPDAHAADGSTGATLHNVYPKLYHCAAYAFTSTRPRPVIEFDRSGWTGSAACSPVVWSGDPTTDWDSVDGLPAMVTQGLNYGYSGVGIYGSDVGGYFSITAPPTTSELLARWLEMGAFSGVMRTESEGFVAPNQSASRSQIWDAGIEPIWRRYAKLRTELYPYIARAAAAYESSGIPLMESLGLAYPSDPHSWQGIARYLFGPDLLVAPVTTEGARSASFALPPGRWIDFWSAVRYRARDGSFHLISRSPARAGGHVGATHAPSAIAHAGATQVLPGGSTVTVAAPLEQIPLFVRSGTLLAMLPPDVATLATYGRHVVHLGDRRGRLHLLAWPDGASSTVALGTTLRSRLTRSAWLLRVGGSAPVRSLSIEAALHGCVNTVTFNGRVLARERPATSNGRAFPRERFRDRGGVLTLTLRSRGTLRVSLVRSGRCVR